MEKIAILIPCYNEELTVKKVVTDFKTALPKADIYVYDNNSTDNTAEIAKKAGAIVRKEPIQGKGAVVKSMFRDIDADVYVIVDGDDTYPADEVKKLIDPIINKGADMVIGDRLSSTYFKENKRPFHNFGNTLVRNLINLLFKANIKDIMTGYRGFSYRFVKSMPIKSKGFQIETEMSVFALVYGMNIEEVTIQYKDRPEGSNSKLNTFKDGFKVLLTIFNLCKNYRPFLFFGLLSLLVFIVGLIVGIPVIAEFIETSFITKVPSAILASALCLNAFILFAAGMIMDSIKNQTIFLFNLNLNRIIEEKKKL